MANAEGLKIRKAFGAYLKQHREEVLKEKNLLVFSYSSELDNSKLRKIERGEIDIRFSTLLQVIKTYRLSSNALPAFKKIIEDT